MLEWPLLPITIKSLELADFIISSSGVPLSINLIEHFAPMFFPISLISSKYFIA